MLYPRLLKIDAFVQFLCRSRRNHQDLNKHRHVAAAIFITLLTQCSFATANASQRIFPSLQFGPEQARLPYYGLAEIMPDYYAWDHETAKDRVNGFYEGSLDFSFEPSVYHPQEAIDSLSTQKELRRLTIQGDSSAFDLSSLNKLDHLATISFIDANISQLNIQQLAGIKSLNHLYVQFNRDPLPWVTYLGALNNVEHFELHGLPIEAEQLQFLKQLPKLHRLQISTRNASSVIPLISELKELDTLAVTFVDDADISLLSHLPKLHALEVCGSGVHGETLNELQHEPLEYLAIVACPLSDSGYDKLTKLTSLQALQLSCAPDQQRITPENLLKICNLKKLRLLDVLLHCTDMKENLHKLSNSLPNCTMHGIEF